MQIVDENGVITHTGKVKLTTANPREAFYNAELIFITIPATMMKSLVEIIYSNTDSKTIIGVVLGNGGSERAFSKCIERGNIFFGIERVPAIARLIQKGKIVKSTGYYEELHVAALSKANAKHRRRNL